MRKIALVGTGFVGMSMAYSLINQGGINELVLIDINKDKTKGEELDLSHGLPFAQDAIKIKAGDYMHCKDVDIVVITAGIPRGPGETRLELTEKNTKIIKEITKKIMDSGFDGIIVVASNPVDLMTYVVYKESGLPKSKVIGTGTLLDTSRLRCVISNKFNISPKNIHAYVMGEHGDSSFVPWTHSFVGCLNICDYIKEENMEKSILEEICQEVRDVSKEIIETKKATYYGIGMALTRLVKAILEDENTILPVSTYLEGEYSQKDICIGVPAKINRKGIEKILELKLSEEEKQKFDNSCNILNKLKSEI